MLIIYAWTLNLSFLIIFGMSLSAWFLAEQIKMYIFHGLHDIMVSYNPDRISLGELQSFFSLIYCCQQFVGGTNLVPQDRDLIGRNYKSVWTDKIVTENLRPHAKNILHFLSVIFLWQDMNFIPI